MSTAQMTTTETAIERRDNLAERLVQSATGTWDIFTVHLGDQLGFYSALSDNGSMTPSELASRTGTHERYVREWLEQQTVAGILAVENAEVDANERRFYLPAGHEEVLADRDNLSYLTPLAQIVAGAVSPFDRVLEAYRSGGGVPFAAYGRDLRDGQARMNRAAFLELLGREWLPSIPDVHHRLQSDPPAQVADIGCGAGWSSIGIAKSYSRVKVDGFDLDEPSVEAARNNAWESGVAKRATFETRDAGDPELADSYDLVTAFECIHDMSQPVAVLRAMRQMVKDDGAVIVVDERVGETFTPSGNEIEGLLYGFSVMHCLPASMTEHPSAATGTVMRPSTLSAYAREAGFREVEILPIENFFFRFYRLHV